MYNEEIGAYICGELVEGRSLKEICAEEGMPSRMTVYNWILRNEKFKEAYTLARMDQADTLADEIISIADDKSNDTITNPETGEPMQNKEWINRSRLRIDARKWIAAKMKPKKYGDMVYHRGDSNEPISVEINMGQAAIEATKAISPHGPLTIEYDPDGED